MAEEDKDSKTEEPTERRLGKAREDGDVPMSTEVRNLFALFGVTVALATMAPLVVGWIGRALTRYVEHADSIRVDTPSNVIDQTFGTLGEVALALALPVSLFVALAILGSVWQVGLLYTPKKMIPKLSTISPISGFKRLFSMNQVVEVGKGLLKVIIVGLLLWLIIWPQMPHPSQILDMALPATMELLRDLLLLLFLTVTLLMVVIAAADLAWQRYSHRKKLKMTKKEVKDEHKDVEGNPQIKAKIRQIRFERHRQRMMAAVPRADVVITNPTHYAVALRYDMETMGAPVLTAKGVDYLARRMRELAVTHEVPVVENPMLARALYASVEIDQEVPPEHYKAVAEVIGYVMRLRGGAGRRAGTGGEGTRWN
ncbi:flagellar biosynthesis protein FlhB [Roseospirillum parvum]|uniref:Flagellar biosynthetic protein FlhB n=1 Tax=Roseospirillum parvum TaxID=83401 RepID=A0A1G8DH82_9PROT|nr:flagellar biosynthesis protein FlhB [Roseospirillum parvum]SDH56971.1 flagellar biosynthetic protein FlhB [Roseospirillum parvum]